MWNIENHIEPDSARPEIRKDIEQECHILARGSGDIDYHYITVKLAHRAAVGDDVVEIGDIEILPVLGRHKCRQRYCERLHDYQRQAECQERYAYGFRNIFRDISRLAV